MVFQRRLSDNKPPQVSRTLLSILTNLSNAVVWIVSTYHIISKSSNPLVTVPRAPITVGIAVTFMLNIFFHFPSKVQVLIPLFAFFQFYCVVIRYRKVHILQVLFFCFCFFILGSGRASMVSLGTLSLGLWVIAVDPTFIAFFPSLKQNSIAHRSSKVSSRPDCIFEIH